MAITFGPGISITGGGNFSAGTPLYPPTVTAVVVSGTTATVSFSAPPLANNPGVLYYVATSTPGNIAATGVTSPIVVSGLSTGTSYTFSVSAVHGLGYGVSQSGARDYVLSTPGSNSLYAWGANGYGELGLGNRTYYSSPTQVGALTNWLSVAAADNNSFGIQNDNSLWAWGYNAYGELGVGNKNNYSSPRQVGALTNWKVITGVDNTMAIKTDGSLWTWGYNGYGQLGLGNRTYFSSPRQVGALTNWSTISSSWGGHSVAIKTDGTLWAWGLNNHGQLGLGTTINYSSPQQVGSLTNWSKITGGASHVIAIKTDGSLWTWGYNGFGQLGLGNCTYYSSPTQVGALTNWLSVAASSYNSLAIKTDGTLWVWGRNNYGQLGQGTTTSYSSPRQVGALTNWSKIVGGGGHAIGIKTNGTLWTWGWNFFGQLGLGNAINYYSPTQVGALTTWSNVSAGSSHTLAISSIPSQSAPGAPTAVTATATGSTTANITYTAPATGSTATSFTAVSTPGGITASTSSGAITVAGLSPLTTYTFQVYGSNSAGSGIWSAVSNSTTTLRPAGSLWTWGLNSYPYYQLGLGDSSNRSSPSQLGALTSWLTISAGYRHSLAIRTDGTLWAWGNNQSGQLGLGGSSYLGNSSPSQVGVLTNWTTVAASGSHTAAIKTDGTLWAWGNNSYGQLGLGNTTQYKSPKQVGSSSNWTVLSAGFIRNTAAIKTDGTLWVWGDNSYNQLGLGNSTYYSSPKQVGALTNWKTVTVGGFNTFAIKTDGTLWAWGRNAYGELGLNSVGGAGSPCQVGALTNWLQVSASTGVTLAVKTDGTLWTWGYNHHGSLGLGNTTYYSSPKQVGALTNWLSTACGSYIGNDSIGSLALKTDGTIWSWGLGNGGALGLGTFYRSSPAQIGGLTSWIAISAGGNMAAIHT